MFILILIILVVLFIFISIKIDKIKYRAKQTILGRVGLSNSSINESINNVQETNALKKIALDYPNFTEEYLKNTLYTFAIDVVNGKNNGFMEDKALGKINSNSLQKYRTLNFVRISILGYKKNMLSCQAIFTNGRDEFNLVMMFDIKDNLLYLNSFNTMNGVVGGF